MFSPFFLLPKNYAFLNHSHYICLLSTDLQATPRSAPGGDHSESSWGARFDVPLTALYAPGDDA
jgi:hypothetical protein